MKESGFFEPAVEMSEVPEKKISEEEKFECMVDDEEKSFILKGKKEMEDAESFSDPADIRIAEKETGI